MLYQVRRSEIRESVAQEGEFCATGWLLVALEVRDQGT
jgi:hypothetical protein